MAAVRGKTRQRQVLNYKKITQKLERQQLPPEPKDLIYGKKALEMGPDKYNLVFEIQRLHKADLPITLAGLARVLGYSRSTLYRKFGRDYLRKLIGAYTVDTSMLKYQDHFQDIGKGNKFKEDKEPPRLRFKKAR